MTPLLVIVYDPDPEISRGHKAIRGDPTTVEDIPNLVRDKLNDTGKKYELVFQVSQQVLSEGGWLKLFIATNVEDKNRIIANQIISDVEEECTVASEHELLLIPVPEIEDPF